MKKNILLLIILVLFSNVTLFAALVTSSTQGNKFFFSLMRARPKQDKRIVVMISSPKAGVAVFTNSAFPVPVVTYKSFSAGVNEIELATLSDTFDDAGSTPAGNGVSTITSGLFKDCYTTIANSPQNQGYMIETYEPDPSDLSKPSSIKLNVSVYAGLSGTSTSDCANVYPIDALGTEYYVMSRSGNSIGTRYFVYEGGPQAGQVVSETKTGDYPSEAVIVATADNTQIDIYPSCLLQGLAQSDTVVDVIPITLNRGQTYLIRALSADSLMKGADDLTGTRVVVRDDGNVNGNKCKKIAVFSGSQHGCGVNQPFNNGDLEYDQLFPTDQWGTDYIAGSTCAGSPLRDSSDVVRVVASQPCTQVYINNNLVATLNPGEYYQHRDYKNEGTFVHASKPVEVCLFTTGQDVRSKYYDTSGSSPKYAEYQADGGPAAIVLASLQKYLREITFSAYKAEYSSGKSNVTKHCLMITSLTSIREYTTLNDGTTTQILSAANNYIWKLIPSNPKYSQLIIDNISKTTAFTLKNTYPQLATTSLDSIGGFNAIVYGSEGKNAGYGYSVGASATKIVTSFNLNDNDALNSANLSKDICVSENVDFNPKFPAGISINAVYWDFNGDDVNDTVTTAANDYKASYKFLKPGTYTVRMIASKSEQGCNDKLRDTIYATFTIKESKMLSVTNNNAFCKSSVYPAPLDPSLAGTPITDLTFKWVTVKSNGRDSTMFAATKIDTIPLALDYGQSRTYWRKITVAGNACTEFVDTFHIKIKDVVTSPVQDLGLVCKHTTLTGSRTSSSESDFTGKTPLYQWYNASSKMPISGANAISYTINDDFGAVSKYYLESTAGCKFVDTFKVSIPKKISNTLTSSLQKVCGDGNTEVTISATESGDVTNTVWEVSDDGVSYNILSILGKEYKYRPTSYKKFKITSSGLCENTSKAPAYPAIESVTDVAVNPPFVATLDVTSDDFVSLYTLPISGGKVVATVETTVPGSYLYTWTPIEIIAGSSYSDKLTEEKTYQVLVKTNDTQGQCSSLSNTITVKLGSVDLHTIIIPNSKNSKNRTFADINEETGETLNNTFTYGYKLTIFNRYGQIISTTLNGGWDGTYKGKVADAGVYFYVLEYNTVDGSKQMKGSIEVIK